MGKGLKGRVMGGSLATLATHNLEDAKPPRDQDRVNKERVIFL